MRAISGVKATGNITLGNYLGALQHWVKNQDKYDENFYFIPDLHSLNIRPEPQKFNEDNYDAIATLLAVGIDPAHSSIFLQSQISAHSELFNILNNYVTMGELGRMVQFKEKQQKYGSTGLVAGFFEYPVLMAADILLYDVDEVPVGDDQKQHVELAHEIARRFNNAHGETFKLFKPVIQKETARIMDLQDPLRKMSKSDEDASGCILINEPLDKMRQKILRAVTDSGNEIRAAKDKPAISNLLNIYATLSGQGVTELEAHYRGRGYGEFKQDLAEVVINVLKPIQDKYQEFIKDRQLLESTISQGKAKAEPIAQAKIKEVKQKIGLITD